MSEKLPTNTSVRIPRPQEELGDIVQCCQWDGEPLDPTKDVIRAPIGTHRKNHWTYNPPDSRGPIIRTRHGWEKIPQDPKIRCRGQFCSLSCAKAYMTANSFPPSAMSLLAQMASTYYGWYGEIPNAPPQEALSKYGGYMSVQEFRDKSITHHTTIKHPPYLMEGLIEEIERRDVPTLEIPSQLSIEEFRQTLQNNADKQRAKFQEKRNKHRKLWANSLEKVMISDQ